MPHRLVYVAPDPDALFEECEERLDRLRAAGFDVCIAAPEGDGLDSFAYRGFDVRPLPGKAKWNVPGLVGAYLILQADFLESPPTLVHGFGTPWAWIAAFAAHRAEAAAIFSSVEHHDFVTSKPRLQALLAAIPDALLERVPDAASAFRLLGRWVDGYLVHHEGELHELIERRVVDRDRLELVLGGRGVDLLHYDIHDEELPDRDEARTLLEIPPDVRTVIGIAGRWTKSIVARFRQLERALARTHPGLSWLLVDPPEDVAAHSTAGTTGEATPTFYRAIDVLLDLDEANVRGTHLMQAAAMRVPVVAIDSPAARTTIVDFETGRIAADEDVGDALVEVLGDSKRASDMGIRARARAETRFDRRQIDEQIITLYDRVLSRKMAR